MVQLEGISNTWTTEWLQGWRKVYESEIYLEDGMTGFGDCLDISNGAKEREEPKIMPRFLLVQLKEW